MSDENKKPEQQSESLGGNTTHDLRKHAQEALRLLREAQAKAADMPSSEPAETGALLDEDEAHRVGNTTYDLAREAQEAMRKLQSDNRSPEEHPTEETAVIPNQTAFDKERMLLRIEVADALNPLLMTVQDDMLIGRGDNVTEYTPDIDLTKYGAYRLGLSRRHATLCAVEDRLELTDLGSRNGTLVNGTRLDPHTPYTITSGDEVQFGNLSVRLFFQEKSQ